MSDTSASDTEVAEQPPANETAGEGRTKKWVGLFGGVFLCVGVLLVPAPEGLSAAAWATTGVALLMACWWITEAIPIAATALVPLVLFPVLDIRGIGEAAAPYANPIIFLFMGGFIIAKGMQAWKLHRRIALRIVKLVGVQPASIVIGFIIASAVLSMWVSNTATALMMLPIGLSVIELARERAKESDRPVSLANFSLVLVLSIAYACNIGGTGTLIGTPPNALLAGFMQETYDVEIGFAQWLAVGLPLVVVSLPIMYVVLTWVYPLKLDVLPGGAEVIRTQLDRLGTITTPETRVAIIFGVTALLWITRPLLQDVVPGLSDAGIAMAASLALFILPSGSDEQYALLNWDDAESLPWGVLILFGGGLSLAAAISDTGLSEWIGSQVEVFSTWPVVVLLLAVVGIIIMLTEITSNTATAAAFLPILASVAVGIGQNPFLLTIPAALAASCAFMLPVATPPNAIVYSSSFVSIPQMSRVGLWLNLVFMVLIALLAYVLLGLVFGVEVGVLPAWAGGR